MSTFVPFPDQKNLKNGAQNRENPCSTESVILTTPPTPNHGFDHPKHLKNSSDFINKSNLKSGCPQNTEFPPFQTPGKEIVTTNGEKGKPQRVQKRTGNSLNSINGPPIQQLVAQVSHSGAQRSQNDAHRSQKDAQVPKRCQNGPKMMPQ